MGTRASFWLGDPRDLDNRQWLGCVAWDGYPDSFPQFAEVKEASQFEAQVQRIAENAHDFADPKTGGWPFPWAKDIFLTDYTYAFFDGAVQVACFHHGFVRFDEQLSEWLCDESVPENPTLYNVPAPTGYDRSQPDSILVLSSVTGAEGRG